MADTSPELLDVGLDDKYERESGRIFCNGTQALVRLPMTMRRRDKAAGLNTACFISGYRGSPLSGIDRALWQAEKLAERNNIHFQPGVNEDLAATAVWGSQQANLFGDGKYDGVFGMWYGKGPGVDRSGDALRHANLAGVSPYGGVLALAGDDHTCKSSTTAHQTEYAFMDAMIPVLSPAGVQEFLDLGIFGWELSRYSGCWTAFKTIADTVDSSASVYADPGRVKVVMPDDFEMPPGGLSIRWPDPPPDQDLRLHRHKLWAALAFARANRIDKVAMGPEDPKKRRFGIVTSGKSYLDVRQALDDLGIAGEDCERWGIAVYKVAMVWPLEREGVRKFASGLEEILVVEERRAVIENQLKEQLYNWDADKRPRIVGKYDEEREWILPSAGELTPARIARAIADRLRKLDPPIASPEVERRVGWLDAKEKRLEGSGPTAQRMPYFCSGCPHNSSTDVPEGSRALAGIGCHYMAIWMDRRTETFSQMGGEGAAFIGQAPFVDTEHVFVNLGDGTYFHSGLLAIRAAVASGVNVTYKILFNDAVAMTGGQPMDGQLDPATISRQVAAEGARRIVLVSDKPKKYTAKSRFAAGAEIRHRDGMEAIQKELRQVKGVSVLIYDQTCAAEKRRRRKRGLMEDPAKRAFINQAVCEGCGDCSVKSNCLSVAPAETAFGRKRQIDQSSCNKDFSCVNGFCPSFVTVHGGELRKPTAANDGNAKLFEAVPEPTPPAIEAEPYGIVVTGIGGTGVVTIGALLGMAAHLESKGCSVMDMTGLAQKGGAVVSHVRIARTPEDIHAVRIAAGQARLVLGCDFLTASSHDVLAKVRKGESRAVIDTRETITGAFAKDPDFRLPADDMREAIDRELGAGMTDYIDASSLAVALLGDSIATNLFMVGHAFQKGLIPLSSAAIERSIELNGAAVDANMRAFLWGRRAAVDPDAVRKIVATGGGGGARKTLGWEGDAIAANLSDMVARRKSDLTAYQNAALADRFEALVKRAQEAEAKVAPGREALAETVARCYHKLLAIKDEWEVARLYSDGRFRQKLRESFEGDYTLRFHLAPPLIAPRDGNDGHPRKLTFGPWTMTVFGFMAKLRGLRGTALDIFGHTAERKRERALIGEYEALIDEALSNLTAENHDIAVALAAIPDRIRGFGHVKAANIEAAKRAEAALMARFRDAVPAQAAE